MIETPVRHILLLTVLLFIILSSGSLQCALNCYDPLSQHSADLSLVADCHPLAFAEPALSPLSNFCHHGPLSRGVEKESALQSVGGGQLLGLFSPRCETPNYRSAEPVEPSFATLSPEVHSYVRLLPLSQKSKQLRSTILLM